MAMPPQDLSSRIEVARHAESGSLDLSVSPKLCCGYQPALAGQVTAREF